MRDPTDEAEVNQKKAQAFLKSMEWGDDIPVGVFFQIEVPTYEERLAERLPGYWETPPAKGEYWTKDGKPSTPIEDLIEGVRVV